MEAVKRPWYRIKKAQMSFLCALCGSQRQMSLRSRPSVRNYIQMTLLISLVCALLWPWMDYRGLVFAPFIWVLWELIHYGLFRRQLPCPHCGFDVAWYAKDVRVAKRKVREFWEKLD